MKRPYISGPMSNVTHHNFPLFFQCEDELEKLGYFPLNPARQTAHCTWESAYEDVLLSNETWESCIRRDVQTVLDSDGTVLLPSWSSSRGACLELVLSISIGNPVYVWFPGQEPEEVHEPALYYQLALDVLKNRGTISPLDMYNQSRPVLY
jgi:hypothetical protein